ncbi:MAG: SoxR reducing system RseC family protein [Planctomycetota bacterium]|jgi:positive regulator of sigma E activity|nr:SoxR reducing system RseC family protein [Planctomycetota bacterium]
MRGDVREAVVVAAGAGRLTVSLETEEGEAAGCSGCAMRGLCGPLGRKRGRFEMTLDLPAGPTLKPGEVVRVFYQPPNLTLAALVMFLPSLAGLFLGGIAARRWLAESDGIFLAGMLAGFVAGLVLSFVFNRLTTLVRPRADWADFEGGGEGPSL